MSDEMSVVAEVAKKRILELEESIATLQSQIEELTALEKEKSDELNAWIRILTTAEPDNHVTPRILYGAGMAAVRQAINIAGKNGVTSKELSEYLDRTKIAVGSSFVGNALSRLKKKGEIYQVGERYFSDETR